MADSKTFTTTPEKLVALNATLKEHGINADVTQPSGRVTENGWNVGWNTPTSGTILVTLYGHPALEGGIFWSKVSKSLA